jgi:transcriptional regulator with XRE-family HTH domain
MDRGCKMKTLANLINEARVSKNLTFSELGRIINLSAMYIYDIEQGKRIPQKINTLKKLSYALGLDYTEIVKASAIENLRKVLLKFYKSNIINEIKDKWEIDKTIKEMLNLLNKDIE